MSVADSLYNLQFIREFCDSCLKSCCHLAVEDMLYTPQDLQVLIQYMYIFILLVIQQLMETLTKIWSTVLLMPGLFCLICLAELAQLPSRTALLV